ncbi:hypothetical protein [Bauldia sp.]|uniref:hypothetical protein n=1 Tax=Bauldia sp. TaxID=2575872 RepID=UPI003BAADA96
MAYWSYRIILWLIALAYAYFTFVRVLNITGMSGFDWASAPLPWQILDVFYLVVNLVVVYGFVLALPIGFVAFFVAAITQLALYFVVEPTQRQSFEDVAFDYRVAFQLVTIALVMAALWLRELARRERKAESSGSG